MLKKNKLREWVPWAQRRSNPDIFYFRKDHLIPNSPHPLLVYRNFFNKEGEACENWLKKKFAAHHWFPFAGVPPFDAIFYYINTHVVLGVCAGVAKWQLGGTLGLTMVVEKGDVLVIPAGVALQHLESSVDFKITGASALNVVPKIRKETSGHSKDPGHVADIPIPETDPVLGTDDGLLTIWLQADMPSR
ncbi:MAG: cupin [Niabella sp.]|nr:cupin [Niabella sp.]